MMLRKTKPAPAAATDVRGFEVQLSCGQNLEAGFESVAKQGQVAVTFEATVYRPYFLVRALLDRGDETLLFDGGFGTIGGYLTDDELPRGRFSFGQGACPRELRTRRGPYTKARCRSPAFLAVSIRD